MAIVKPEWAKAVIVAKLREDMSDPMTDYFAGKTTKLIVLAWSKHNRDLFPEMRRAADLLPETQYLGTGKGLYRILEDGDRAPWLNNVYYASLSEAESAAKEQGMGNYEVVGSEKGIEHREKYSMGAGYYLGRDRHSGWVIEKLDLRGGYNDKEVDKAIAAGNHVFDGNRPTCLQEVETVEEVAAVEPANNVIPFRAVAVVEAVEPNYVVITDAPVIEPVIISAEKKKPVKVELLRAEGTFDDCVKVTIEQTFGTGDVIGQANQILRFWAMTAPDDCGYDKCDFTITYDDGETYKGRYDLTRADVMRASLKTHIEEYAEYINDPDFASIPSYQEAKVYYAHFLSQYHIG